MSEWLTANLDNLRSGKLNELIADAIRDGHVSPGDLTNNVQRVQWLERCRELRRIARPPSTGGGPRRAPTRPSPLPQTGLSAAECNEFLQSLPRCDGLSVPKMKNADGDAANGSSGEALENS